VTRFTLKGLVSRKLRATLTAIAIVLGVAMVSGTFMLTDTMQKAFDQVFASSYTQTDAVLSGRKVVDWSQSGKPTVPESTLARVRELPQVAAASGQIVDLSGDVDLVKLIDKEGKPIQAQPSFGLGVDTSQPRFNPFELADGRWAKSSDEVVLDAGTASKHDFHVGDLVRVAGDGPAIAYRLVGVARFGEVDSIGSAAIAVFDVPTAQQIHHKRGFDTISVAAKDGVSQAELTRSLERIVPPRVVVHTGAEQAAEDGKGVNEFLKYIRWMLLGFGGVSLFVGAFVIFNTLSITVAQRTRELATLRTLGASRRQVLRAVVLEGFVIGAFASLVGLAAGFGLAAGLRALLDAVGASLPTVSMVLRPRTVVVSLALGIGITLIASIVPAIRATRIPAISAVREGAAAARARISGRTTAAAVGVVAASAGALVYGTLAHDVPGSARVAALVFGAIGLFVGTAMLAPRLVRPLTAVVGLPSARFGGTAGRLARDNALRNPGRTASTAAALMIGLTLVTFVAVLARGLIHSDQAAVRGQLDGVTHVVTPQGDGDSTMPVAVGDAVASARGVSVSSSVRTDMVSVDGSQQGVSGVDPATIGRVYRFEWKQGSDEVLSSLANGGAIVDESIAEDKHLGIGDRLVLRTASDRPLALTVKGVYSPSKFDPLLGSVVVSQKTFDASFSRPGDALTLVRAASATPVEQAISAYPDTAVKTEDAFVADRSADLTSILGILYALLGLSVVVSLLGMINTLVLAVFERTRELGMLRAVGMTRRQVRRMIRHEAVVIALIGAGIGLPLGIGLGALVIQALSQFDVSFSLPVGTLAVFTVVAIVAGLLAALLPARRASRLNVLHALQYE
jgi:putative ABC transport system permease protein